MFNYCDVRHILQVAPLLGAPYMVLVCWTFFYLCGYLYYWYFSIPWLLAGLFRLLPAIRPSQSERHATAKKWAWEAANIHTIREILSWGIRLWRESPELELEELLFCSLMAGGLANFRQSPRNIVWGMLRFFGMTLVIIVLANAEDIIEIIQEVKEELSKEESGTLPNGDASEHTLDELYEYVHGNSSSHTFNHTTEEEL
jgi:hypothetical protein